MKLSSTLSLGTSGTTMGTQEYTGFFLGEINHLGKSCWGPHHKGGPSALASTTQRALFVVDKLLERSSAKESVPLPRRAYQSICSTADAKKIRLGLWAGTLSIKVIKVSPSTPRTMTHGGR